MGLNLGGYAFPKPGLFVSVSTKEKQRTYLTSWLKLRKPFIQRAVALEWAECLISNQEWRTLLTLTFVPPNATASIKAKSEETHRRLLSLLGNLVQPSDLELSDEGASRLTWNGHDLDDDKILSPNTITEIVWELTELNFRFELTALDDYLCGEAEDAAVGEIQPRFLSILRCCAEGGNGFVLAPDVARANEGLAAADIRSRMPYLVALRDLMLSWRGLEKPQLMPQIMEESWVQRDEEVLKEFERGLTEVYTATFYKIFGRPPIIPHSLPLTVDVV